MTGDTHDAHWGERRAAQRNRRRWSIAAAAVAITVAFGLAGQYVVPHSADGDVASLIWVSALLVVAAVVLTILWRSSDEIARRVTVNSAAIPGGAAAAMLMLAQAAGRLLPIAHPMMAVLMAGTGVFVAAIAVQRIRG